jgi:hypothetical protein
MPAKYTKNELRQRLSWLANVPPLDPATDPNWTPATDPDSTPSENCFPTAEDFIKKYGPLRPHPKDRDSMLAEQEAAEYARRFRQAWNVKTDFDYQVVNGHLQEVFRAGDPFSGERGIRADFETGRWEPIAGAALLDWLALELMVSRKMLHRCERPECRRYFVKTFSRAKYCGVLRKWERELDRIGECSEVMRHRNQSLSANRKSKGSSVRGNKRRSK